jgi:hypothetical protein
MADGLGLLANNWTRDEDSWEDEAGDDDAC